VESDIEWQNKLKQTITNPIITYIFNDMDTRPNDFGNPGRDATELQMKNYSEHMKKLINTSNKIAFVGGAGVPYDETMSGFGGTQLSVLNIANELSKNYEVYVVHDKRTEEFTGKSGVKYVRSIEEELFRVIVDVRFLRDKFVDNVKYLHLIQDPHLYNGDRSNLQFKRYDHVITLTNIQKSLWDKEHCSSGFEVINNPLVLEPTPSKQCDKYKIVAFSSKTMWGKCIDIVKKLRSFDDRFTLHVCSPSYSDISNKMKEYDFVVNHGTVTHGEMMEILSDAFVCLYPTTFQESFGCVCCECMHYGVPMLTEYVHGSGTNEIIPENLVFPSNCDSSLYIDTITGWHTNDNRPVITWNHRNDEIYSQWSTLVGNTKVDDIDVVLIDGMFRVPCCLKCHDIISDDCLIAFDDFLRRPDYHVVLDYFDVVEHTIDNGMIILKKKKNTSVPIEIIEKYELIKG